MIKSKDFWQNTQLAMERLDFSKFAQCVFIILSLETMNVIKKAKDIKKQKIEGFSMSGNTVVCL